jgi:hypothetical protein
MSKAKELLLWCKEHCTSASLHNCSTETGRELNHLKDALDQLSEALDESERECHDDIVCKQ